MRIGHRLALTAILLLALPVAVLAPVSAAPIVAATQTLSVDGSDPAATDATCAPCKTIQGAINRAGSGDAITVAPGTYPETLTITQGVSITGSVPLLPDEQGPTIVDAGGTGRVVTIPSGLPAMLVSLTGLTLTHGSAPDGGGIAALAGTLSLSDTTIMSNTAGDRGGGILGDGPVTLTHCTVMRNTAGGGGGGMFGGGPVSLTDSPVMSNTASNAGGGIFGNQSVTLADSPVMSNSAGGGGGIVAFLEVTLTGSAVTSNTATYGNGGGLLAGGPVTLTDSPVMSNTANYGNGGGLFVYGVALVLTSTVAGNTAASGGGLAAQGTGSALLGSAVLSNTARSGDGGGIFTSGSLSITNSTVSANSAITSGGAISSTGSLTASFSTVSANSALSGGGIAAMTGATTTLNASILAGNTAPIGTDCTGALTSRGDNLIGDADGCSGVSAAGDLTGSGVSPLDARLGAPADNGGPTLTQALLPGSPAINHVPAPRCTDASGAPLTGDQRGVVRPDPGDLSGSCDGGAYEYNAGPVILAVAPSTGPLVGGTQVAISGTDMEGTSALSVTVGGIPATDVITDSSGQLITATTPAHAAGTVDVAVGVLVGTSVMTTPVTPADQFTYGAISTGTPTTTGTTTTTATTTATSTATDRPQPTRTPTSTPTSASTPLPTSTPTSEATATTAQGLVATSTATARPVLPTTPTATPTRPLATATHVPASRCRKALPLHVRLSRRTLRSAGTVVIRARTVSRARLSVVVRVLAKKTVVIGTGTHRRRVVRTIVVYRASATGRADARGRFQGQVQVTYHAARSTRALLTVTAQVGCAAATARLRMTILPRRRH